MVLFLVLYGAIFGKCRVLVGFFNGVIWRRGKNIEEERGEERKEYRTKRKEKRDKRKRKSREINQTRHRWYRYLGKSREINQTRHRWYWIGQINQMRWSREINQTDRYIKVAVFWVVAFWTNILGNSILVIVFWPVKQVSIWRGRGRRTIEK